MILKSILNIDYYLFSVMSAGRAKPVSQLETDRLFEVSDRVRVIIL